MIFLLERILIRVPINVLNKLSFALDKPQIGFRTSEFSLALVLE